MEITEQRLKEAIQLCNEERELLKRISLMRRSAPPPISEKAFVMLNHASMILDKNASDYFGEIVDDGEFEE